jgi:hypothetical protein
MAATNSWPDFGGRPRLAAGLAAAFFMRHIFLMVAECWRFCSSVKAGLVIG